MAAFNANRSAVAPVEAFDRPLQLRSALQSLAAWLPPGAALDVQIQREKWRIGVGPVKTNIWVQNPQGMTALATLDPQRISQAVARGDLRLEGEFVATPDGRDDLPGKHPRTSLWSAFIRFLFQHTVSRTGKRINGSEIPV